MSASTAPAILDTGWTRALTGGTRPDDAAVLDHLQSVHSANAGFTEACAVACRDAEGRDSYDWLAQTLDGGRPAHVLDLACGSGVLLERLVARQPAARLTGVDMSADELALARERLDGRMTLHRAMAQDLGFLPDGAVDAVLCHWALTLMQPVAPVLAEVARVLSRDGLFAAIVDGPMESAPGYPEVNAAIFDHVSRAYPLYGTVDLGDPRVRDGGRLLRLLAEAFPDARVTVEPNVVSMAGPPATLAREASSFFYSVFVLDAAQRAAMLNELTALFAGQPDPAFHMPINRVVVQRG